MYKFSKDAVLLVLAYGDDYVEPGFYVYNNSMLYKFKQAEIKNEVAHLIGPIAKPDKIQFVSGLPKTRSGKIMRRILRKIASDETDFGDTSTLLDPDIVTIIQKGKI